MTIRGKTFHSREEKREKDKNNTQFWKSRISESLLMMWYMNKKKWCHDSCHKQFVLIIVFFCFVQGWEIRCCCCFQDNMFKSCGFCCHFLVLKFCPTGEKQKSPTERSKIANVRESVLVIMWCPLTFFFDWMMNGFIWCTIVIYSDSSTSHELI